MRHKSLAALLMVGASLAAAAPALAQGRSANARFQDPRFWNPTLYSTNQPVVERTDYVMDLLAQGSVSDLERGRLLQWFETLRLGYGDRISVDTGGYDNGDIRRDVAEVAARYGLLLSDGYPVTAGAVQPGYARVVVSRSVASVPGCPNWSETGEIGSRTTTPTNYGCAINSNLAAMVADANDLVLGQVGDPSIDAAHASKAVDAYRNRTLTGNGGQVKAESAGGK